MGRRITLLSLALLLSGTIVSSAGAIEFSIIGPTSATITPGGSVTIDVAVDNASATSTFGVTGTLSGLAAAGATATSGQSAVAHFVLFCAAPPTNCLGGLNTVDNQFYNPNDLSMSGAYTPGNDTIEVVNALSLQATTADGSLDPGLDGGITTPSARDVTITLTANTVGTHVLTFDGTFSDGTNVLPIQSSATFTLTVPEPGAMIASLTGLGSVLAVVGMRRRHHR